jgi:hypothetical protein
MTAEPKRLLDEDPEFARLVAASEEDVPSPARVDEAVALARRLVSASRWRTWRLLGSGGALAGATMLGLLAVMTSTSSGNGPKPPGRATPVLATPGPTNDVPPAAFSVEAPLAPAEAVAPSAQPAPVASPPNVVRSTETPRARAPVDVRSGKPADVDPKAAHAESSTFDEELALLSAARSGLETKDIPASLRAVERYQTRFRSGLFAEEMEVIRIDALAASGERARAHVLAEQFLAANPRSTYAARVRSLAERTRD